MLSILHARATAGATLALGAVALVTLTAASSDAAASATLDRRIKDATVTESSGLAHSTYDRSTMWTHNDSGSKPRVFAVGQDGATQAVVTLTNAASKDWEDIAAGPNHTLWVGDIGDNDKTRSSIQVYRFTEPATLATQSLSATRFDLTYPDGKHNAEAMMVHPTTGRVYVATKSPSGGAIYAAPASLSTSGNNTMTKVASGTPVKITAGAFAPDGKRFVLCNYAHTFVYSGFGATPTEAARPSLDQGESLEISADGAWMYLGSEGTASPVYRLPFLG